MPPFAFLIPCSTVVGAFAVSSTFEIVTVQAQPTRIAKFPQVAVGPHPVPAAVTRVFLIVTFRALTLIVPDTSRPLITAPSVLTLMLPEGLRVVPAGTPTFL